MQVSVPLPTTTTYSAHRTIENGFLLFCVKVNGAEDKNEAKIYYIGLCVNNGAQTHNSLYANIIAKTTNFRVKL